MATGEDNREIREGFLCPICMKDLGTIAQLQIHFENFHSNEDKAVFHSIKDLFGKAKKKILKLDSLNDDFISLLESEQSPVKDSYVYNLNDQTQELGTVTSHIEYFKQIRGSRIDRYVVETNKLLIRLDKLITEMPADPAARKNYEKSVVFWVEDTDVRFCPGCGNRFNISRRRHHCRLCGSIMCANCSNFIVFSFARKLVNSITPDSLTQPNSPIRRNGSNSSLNSLVNATGEPHIRICSQCKLLLDRRNEQMDERSNKPTIVHLYERLKSSFDEAEKLCPIYIKMADSLNLGETNYNLSEAQDVRIKLIRHSESIDMLSKRIMCLDQDNPNQDPLNVSLYKSIRIRASKFLQDNVIGLPSLPPEPELKKLQIKRSEMIRKQIAEERLRTLEFQQRVQINEHTSRDSSREESPNKNTSQVSQPTSSFETELGWGPDTKTSLPLSNDDPMIQQMNNIRNYIKQAKAAHMHDEVQILETNLQELQKEYWNQQKNSR